LGLKAAIEALENWQSQQRAIARTGDILLMDTKERFVKVVHSPQRQNHPIFALKLPKTVPENSSIKSTYHLLDMR
jgi:hypothetical protein